MKKFAIALCGSLLVASAAAPAVAQGQWGLDARIAETERALEKGAADGAITRAEYQVAINNVHDVERRDQQFKAAHGGVVDGAQLRQLEADLDRVLADTHWLRPEWRRPW
jgi:hypothetical protein